MHGHTEYQLVKAGICITPSVPKSIIKSQVSAWLAKSRRSISPTDYFSRKLSERYNYVHITTESRVLGIHKASHYGYQIHILIPNCARAISSTRQWRHNWRQNHSSHSRHRSWWRFSIAFSIPSLFSWANSETYALPKALADIWQIGADWFRPMLPASRRSIHYLRCMIVFHP